MSKIISILGAITIYVGTIDRVTNGLATIELRSMETLEVSEIELPIEVIPCQATEGVELLFIRDDGSTYIECHTGCEG